MKIYIDGFAIPITQNGFFNDEYATFLQIYNDINNYATEQNKPLLKLKPLSDPSYDKNDPNFTNIFYIVFNDQTVNREVIIDNYDLCKIIGLPFPYKASHKFSVRGKR